MSKDIEKLKALLSSPLLDDILSADLTKINRDDLRKVLGLPHKDEFNLLIDYNQTLEQMIRAGLYNWFNGDITAKRFPIRGEGKVSRKVKLVHFNRDISLDGVIAELDKMGKRPATIEELLAFGAQYPEIQREFPVVALGSFTSLNDVRYVVCLCRDGSMRCLQLFCRELGGHVSCRFLALDK